MMAMVATAEYYDASEMASRILPQVSSRNQTVSARFIAAELCFDPVTINTVFAIRIGMFYEALCSHPEGWEAKYTVLETMSHDLYMRSNKRSVLNVLLHAPLSYIPFDSHVHFHPS